jgi:hypothetical protein
MARVTASRRGIATSARECRRDGAASILFRGVAVATLTDDSTLFSPRRACPWHVSCTVAMPTRQWAARQSSKEGGHDWRPRGADGDGSR